jgi:hypothetical protein
MKSNMTVSMLIEAYKFVNGITSMGQFLAYRAKVESRAKNADELRAIESAIDRALDKAITMSPDDYSLLLWA